MTANLLSILALSSVFLTVFFVLLQLFFWIPSSFINKICICKCSSDNGSNRRFEFHNLFSLFYHAINIFPAFHSFSFLLNVIVQNLRVYLHLLYFVPICNWYQIISSSSAIFIAWQYTFVCMIKTK